MNYTEKTVLTEVKYEGNIIDVERITVELPNGKIATRDVVRHVGAAVVIPIDEDGNIYVVEQYRKPFDEVLLELPAGKLDSPDEDPALCAERELKEETGLTAEKIEKVAAIYTTPGFSDEIIHMYMATGLKQGASCTDEDEFLSCKKFQLKELVQMVINNKIKDSKTIIGILYADRLNR